MSRVFLADESRFGRKVVIKVLAPELAAGISSERFEREIKVAASLQQANIVPVLAAGDINGLPFFTMPFVEGESLRARLVKGGALTITEIVRILGDVARALSYAHAHGVVHRDIKPDNVLLSHGTAVVTDFGIAKAVSASRTKAENDTLTQHGTSLGTPAYMSPEQAAGDPDVDQRADIYALGCLAYELLAGRPPFHARTPQRVLAAQMSEVPQAVSELRADAPSALAELVMRCLEKNPDARPQSAADVQTVLDLITSGSGHASMPPILIGRASSLPKVLAVYALSFVGVAIVARAAIIAIGLPDWVFPGAVIVMALGLPAILFTALVQRTTYRALTSTPALTPGGTSRRQGTLATLAVKAGNHVSWRRTALGGALALGAFAVIVAGYMTLRALGIGPPGSLMGEGKMHRREAVLISHFRVNNADSSLGTVLGEAVRTALGQSSAITVVSQATVANALQRMRRPPSSRIDLPLARELAAREGIKVIVDGDITSIGTGFVLSMGLVSTDSGSTLASFRATADGLKELLPAVDDLSRQLRERVGESLKTIHDSPPLEEVTTSSFEALQKYSVALRAFWSGDSRRALALLREAVALDSTFGMAWRLLAINESDQEKGDFANRKAYQLRDRLPDRERLQVIAYYFFQGPGHDRMRATAANEALLARGDSSIGLGRLAIQIMTRREYARAEALLLESFRRYPNKPTPEEYYTLAQVQCNQGKLREAQVTVDAVNAKFPSWFAEAWSAYLLYQANPTDAYERRLDSMRMATSVDERSWATYELAQLALTRGQISDYDRKYAEAQAIESAAGESAPPLARLASLAFMDVWFRMQPRRAVARLDSALARFPLRSLPIEDRPYFDIAGAYAVAQRPDRARAILAQYSADVRDTTLLRFHRPYLDDALAEIALADGRHRDAIDGFRRADMRPDGPVDEPAITVFANLGRAFDQAKQPDSATRMYEGYLTTPYCNRTGDGFDPVYLAPFLERLGQLYDAKGDHMKAVKYYQRFVALWKGADPELQPRVAKARARLAQLRDLKTR